jgi:hypothetical protein
MKTQQHHYFASNGLGWATAESKDEAINKLWQARHTDVKAWLLNAHKDGNLGLPFYVCRVPLEASEKYSINWFKPEVDGLTETGNHLLTYYTQKKIAYAADPNDEIWKKDQQIEQLQSQLNEQA